MQFKTILKRLFENPISKCSAGVPPAVCEARPALTSLKLDFNIGKTGGGTPPGQPAGRWRYFFLSFQTASNIISAVFSISCLVAIFTLSAFTQDTGRPKTKNFGKSLRPKEEKDNSQNSEAASKNQGDDETIKVETNLVRTDVLVIDRKGNAVSGLKADDFVVTENNVTQEIGTFSLGDSAEVPRSIVLIIDYSYSQLPYIENSVNAAKVLVDKLNLKDQMAIVTDDVELLVPFTGDKELLKKKLDSLAKKAKSGKSGKSKQYSALYATVNELFDAQDIRPIIIFQTDGDEAFDIKREEPPNTIFPNPYTTNFTVADLFNSIEKSRITIYSIISGFSLLGLTPEARLKKTEMMTSQKVKDYYTKEDLATKENLPSYQSYQQNSSDRLFKQQTSMAIVARDSGGFVESLETPDQADQIYSLIFNSIAARYLIGYYSSNQERDGKRRDVKIEVRGHPEYILLGRKFYFAPQGETQK